MLKQAMGWLGWTPDVALAMDVGMIELALGSRAELLAMIFGSGEKIKAKGKSRGKVTAASFKNFVKSHNRKGK